VIDRDAACEDSARRVAKQREYRRRVCRKAWWEVEPLSRLLADAAVILTMDDEHRIIDNGLLAVEDGVITYVGPASEYEGSRECEVELLGRDCVMMPGLINAHTHIAMTLYRGFADDMPLKTWLEEKIWPLEEARHDGDVYWGTLLGIVEMIRSGTTCFNDMYWDFEDATRAVKASGIRACPSGVLIGVHPEAEAHFQQAVEFVRAAIEEGVPTVHPMFGPHAPYTCPDAYLERVVEAAKELGVGIHIHLSETEEEVQESLQQTGQRPPAHLAEIGVFDVPVLAPHCVHVDERDREIMREHGVGIAHCPGSNMKLASGIAPLPELMAEGNTVGIGTDGAASNNNLDMLEEIRLAALLHKVSHGDPTVVTAYEALTLATRGSAAALGLGELIGTLEVGKRADFILIDFTGPHVTPLHNPVSHLVYSAQPHDVRSVVVEGKPLMQDWLLTTLDEGEIQSEVRSRARRLTEEASH
jgi:5-methylthioadenosine/S-adenosylhomocysteine deaminase